MAIFTAALSALFSVIGWAFKSLVIKFVVFFALFFIVVGFVEVLNASGILPTADTFKNAMGGIPAGVWYYLNIFKFNLGISLLVSAWATRFIIRRIPVIG